MEYFRILENKNKERTFVSYDRMKSMLLEGTGHDMVLHNASTHNDSHPCQLLP